jgi:hypothetical protein
MPKRSPGKSSNYSYGRAKRKSVETQNAITGKIILRK